MKILKFVYIFFNHYVQYDSQNKLPLDKIDHFNILQHIICLIIALTKYLLINKKLTCRIIKQIMRHVLKSKCGDSMVLLFRLSH